MEDWEGEEHVKFSTEHSGKSQLTLGHIVSGKRKKRGEGFELRTDAQGAVRAGGGLLGPHHFQHGWQADPDGGQGSLDWRGRLLYPD
ncbi:type VI secretion system Vgr family protein [Cupriavidus necator]|uniref:type VI secretion system Vgr family protein n=1 Tax=Cupriavidus necator TaxID=106590 RepID=UPI0038B2C2F7